MPPARAILHLHGVSRAAALDALDAVMLELGFGRDIAYVLGHLGPRDMMDYEIMVRKQPLYLISEPLGEWVAVIPAHRDIVARQSPDPEDLARRMSQALECPALLLACDPGSGFSYRLFNLGSMIGGDNLPGGDGALSLLEPYLPPGTTREQVKRTLHAEPSGADGLGRLESFASALKLDGRPRYLLTAWETSREIPWTRFFAASYFVLRRPA